MKTAVVIGGGFTGCTWARLLAERGFKVTLVERESFLGGGCKTFTYGGHPYTYGPRHLFTPHRYIYDYLDKVTPLRRLNHYLLTYVERDGNFYSYPPHRDDIVRMPDKDKVMEELAQRPDPSTARNFEEYWIYSVGELLYEKFVKNYSKKMWQIESNTRIDDFKFDGKGVQLSTGTKEIRPDWFIAYPVRLNGWDDYFDMCATSENVNVRARCRVEAYDVDRRGVMIDGEWVSGDLLVSSISPDVLLHYQYGKLPYIGRDFLKLVLPIEHVIPDPICFLHYPNDEVFTRVVEYKKLTGYKAPTTLLGIEIPSLKNRLYPYPIVEEQEKANQYRKALPDTVLSVGRMGNYRYMDIGQVIEEALNMTRDL